MYVLEARNAHHALPKGLYYLQSSGVLRGSRNGDVYQAKGPVTTVYSHPTERLVLWDRRDSNVAFLLAEALWMILGRRDLPTITRYISRFGQYSDDGQTLHGAYGHRWRARWGDQLLLIARRLRENPEDRRNVLQMWHNEIDLDTTGRDVPCNLMATFQRQPSGALDLVVFNRSNDTVWGAYFANAYHFSFLQEYMAAWIGCPVGTYEQVSVNYHAYTNIYEEYEPLIDEALAAVYATQHRPQNPYADGEVTTVPLLSDRGSGAIVDFDMMAEELLMHAETGFVLPWSRGWTPFFRMAYAVLRAHHIWRTLPAPMRFEHALLALDAAEDPRCDHIVAMRRWVERRQAKWAENSQEVDRAV